MEAARGIPRTGAVFCSLTPVRASHSDQPLGVVCPAVATIPRSGQVTAMTWVRRQRSRLAAARKKNRTPFRMTGGAALAGGNQARRAGATCPAGSDIREAGLASLHQFDF